MLLRTIICFCFILTEFMPVSGYAGMPPETPFIRMNTQFHSAKVMDITASKDGRMLVTASFDKTVKLWEAASGKLLNTIRPPVGSGVEGTLHAVALAPDGKTVATAGWTGGSWDGNFSVYLFDVATGEMLKRFTGFPKPISKLAFSPESSTLAVGMHASGGLHLISVEDGRRIAIRQLHGACTALRYAPDANLFVTSDGGNIQGYRPDGSQLYSLQTQDRSMILDSSLSPDGRQLALVYKDFHLVELRAASNGQVVKVLHRPGGKFMSVSWSADGTQIMAAGHNKVEDERKLIVVWSAVSGHLDKLVVIPTRTAVSRLLALPGSSVAFVSRLSGFGQLRFDTPAKVSQGVLYRSGPRQQMTLVEHDQIFYHPLEVSDFYKNQNAFRISDDAASVLFSYERHGTAPARFDLKKRRLTVASPQQHDLLHRRVTADNIDVQNWQGSSTPRFNQKPLGGFDPQEISWGLAVRNDERGFVLGTNLYLRFYKKNGQLLFKKRIPYTVKDIAYAADDRTVVAALDDGSIRWYRMPGGDEKYALFPHPDRKRWVLWTPDGFFDYGPGSENLIGFQMNRNADQSSVLVPADRMFDLLYRPDLLERAISGDNLEPYVRRLQDRSRDSVRSDVLKASKNVKSADRESDLKQQRESLQTLGPQRIEEEAGRLNQQGKQVSPARTQEVSLQDEEEYGQLPEAAQLAVQDETPTVLSSLVTAASMPPKVRFLTASRTTHDRDVKVRAELCDVGGGIGNITLFLNRMPILFDQSERGLAARKKEGGNGCTVFERVITLTAGENILSLMALNGANSIESERDSMSIRFDQQELEGPRLHMLVIAVNKYLEKDLRLKYSVNDAMELVRLINEKGRQLFTEIQTYQLYDEQVTRSGMQKTFNEISRKVRRNDLFLLFVAGHGLTDELDGMYYFLPADFRFSGPRSLISGGISINDFKQLISSVQAMRSLFLVDTCNSGAFSEGMAATGVTENTALGKLARSVGRATIAASAKNQVALEGYQGHGVFSYTLFEALKGEAANRKGQITVNSLANFVEETLPDLTYKKWGYQQIPQKALIGSDFSIVMK